jgi:hypothetical protein
MQRGSFETGRLVGLEEAAKILNDVQNEEYKEHVVAISFENLVEGLTELSDDAPVKFVIFAGVQTKKPLTSLNTTMKRLRELAKITQAFS